MSGIAMSLHPKVTDRNQALAFKPIVRQKSLRLVGMKRELDNRIKRLQNLEQQRRNDTLPWGDGVGRLIMPWEVEHESQVSRTLETPETAPQR